MHAYCCKYIGVGCTENNRHSCSCRDTRDIDTIGVDGPVGGVQLQALKHDEEGYGRFNSVGFRGVDKIRVIADRVGIDELLPHRFPNKRVAGVSLSNCKLINHSSNLYASYTYMQFFVKGRD